MPVSILIVTAVPQEMAPISESLNASENSWCHYPSSQYMIQDISFDNMGIRLCVTGAGLVNTAMGLTMALRDLEPDLIIQAGCGGAFKQSGLSVGDIGIATSEIDAHLGIEPTSPDMPISPLPFSVQKNIKIQGEYPLSSTLAAFAHKTLGDTFKTKAGPFLTVSTVTATDQTALNWQLWHNPVIENMEGAAAAHVSAVLDIPLLEIRAVSNMVGQRDTSQWNLPLAFQNSGTAVMVLISSLQGMPCDGFKSD